MPTTLFVRGLIDSSIRIKRQREQPENLRYFISELLHITEVRQIIKELLEK